MEIIQAGVFGHPRGALLDQSHLSTERRRDWKRTRFPEGLNWDFWCGPLPCPSVQEILSGWLLWPGALGSYGDGHLADMGAHAINLPWRALQLGAAQRVTVKAAEPLKDSYPSATDFHWEFPARAQFAPVSVWWHDGPKAGPPEQLGKELISTFDKVPTNGVLFAGEKGLLCSDACARHGEDEGESKPAACSTMKPARLRKRSQRRRIMCR
jgi:hypothetical protein